MEDRSRNIWKTFPWFGLGVTGLMLFVALRIIVTGKVRFENTRYIADGGPKYVRYEDQPLEFSLLLALVVILFTASLWYCVFRIRRRNRLRREDGET
jgi:hypothetical protein